MDFRQFRRSFSTGIVCLSTQNYEKETQITAKHAGRKLTFLDARGLYLLSLENLL
jgi:hypothetical protein